MSGRSDALYVKPLDDGRVAEAQAAYQEMLDRISGRVPFTVTRVIVHLARGVGVAIRLAP